MYNRSLLARAFAYLLPIALSASIYLYLYPAFRGCSFPRPDASQRSAFREILQQDGSLNNTAQYSTLPTVAPFRLLVLADPQLEGDSSLPKPEEALTARLQIHRDSVREARWHDLGHVSLETLKTVVIEDVPQAFGALRKQLDLFGNDYYLAHIYRTLNWWTVPTHVTVLGDLIGSQWTTDDEFRWRGWRYWKRVFKGGLRVEDEVTKATSKDKDVVLDLEDPSWRRRIINVAGNHDIGYAGDIDSHRLARFEEVFGKPNWDVRFHQPSIRTRAGVSPSIHLVILNDLNVDGPAFSEELQQDSFAFINAVISERSRPVEDRTSFTLLLTHVPLHKEDGICIDGPWIDYWGNDDGGGKYRPHGVKEQNHLSEQSSHQGILQSIFGLSLDPSAPLNGRGRKGLILNGHDHEGCDTWHFASENGSEVNETAAGNKPSNEVDSTTWAARKWDPRHIPEEPVGIREVTLRSMMGDFGGNAGFLSLWFDIDTEEWKYDMQVCQLGVQHIWWAVHVLDLITAGAGFLWLVSTALYQVRSQQDNPVHVGHSKPRIQKAL